MSLNLSPEIENIVRERAASEGVSVEELLTRAFATDKIQPNNSQIVPKTNVASPEQAPPETPLSVRDPQAHVRALLAQWQTQDNTTRLPPIPTRPGETPTQALFRQWKEEHAQMTEEEKEAEDRLWEEMEKRLLENGRTLRLRTIEE